MAKSKTAYVCQSCGAQSAKWAGQCGECGEWNTLVETTVVASARGLRSGGMAGLAGSTGVQLLEAVAAEDTPRVSTEMSEMDRVLGGGLVAGSVILIGGDLGIGKSTLLLQVLAGVQRNLKTLYITGEESLTQVHMRAKRLGLPRLDLPVLAETSVERILGVLSIEKPGLVVLDSAVTEELEAEGWAKDRIRELQDARRSHGFDVSDRIDIVIEVPEHRQGWLDTHRDLIAGEVLALSLVDGHVGDDGSDLGEGVRAAITKSS